MRERERERDRKREREREGGIVKIARAHARVHERRVSSERLGARPGANLSKQTSSREANRGG